MTTNLVFENQMRQFFTDNPEVKYILFGGKGGLGKTTLSAATSMWLAKEGKKVCVFSTDPQASLSDIFEKKIFGQGEVEIAKNLYALEIDADKRIAEYQQEIRQKIKDIYKMDEVPEEVEDYINSSAAEPAMAESATFDAMVELMTSGKYEYYVFDMMPHGHAVRFLGMAEILDQWVLKILDVRSKAGEYGDVASVMGGKGSLAQEDMVLKELEFIRGRLDFVSNMVRDKKHTAFFYVLIPELMPILDTQKALELFRAFNVTVSGIVVNQVYPRELKDEAGLPEFYRNKITSQQQYLEQIKKDFSGLITGVVPMLDKEPKGLEMISKITDHLYGK
ncbi:MAG TPA: ArsA family ATPase [Candidatus Bathyarchaeia archaeon]|nr:ArsA family ATPase [Candidatus Bathyarchaeia archaeon]